MSMDEHPLMASFGQLMALQARYVAGELSAAEFGEGLTPYVTDDMEFWCNFTPASPSIRPLFAGRRGREGLIERYRIEHELERVVPGTTEPRDVVVGGECIYLSMSETASFVGGPEVTFDAIVKISFVEGQMARFEMFVDGRPIDAAYPADPD